MNPNKSISFSRLSSYSQCPRREYLEYRLMFPKEQNEFAIAGSEAHEKEESNATPNAINYGNELIQALSKDKKYAPIIQEKGIKPNLSDQGVGESIAVYAEHKLSMKLTEELCFTGFIDLYFVIDDTAFIMDYKFTNKSVAKYDQLRYYALLIKKKHPQVNLFLGSFIYPLLETRKDIVIYEEELSVIRDSLIAKARELDCDVKGKMKLTPLCEYCPFAAICKSKSVDTLIKLQSSSDALVSRGIPSAKTIVAYNDDVRSAVNKIWSLGISLDRCYFVNTATPSLNDALSLNKDFSELVFSDEKSMNALLGVDSLPQTIVQSEGKMLIDLSNFENIDEKIQKIEKIFSNS